MRIDLDTAGLDGEDWPKRTDDRIATINAEAEPDDAEVDDDVDVD